MRAILLIMVAIVAIPGGARAASMGIGSVVEIQDDTPVRRIGVSLDLPLKVTSRFKQVNETRFKASAVAVGEALEDGWQFVELALDEADYSVASVRLEGSRRKGFEITLAFHAPVYLDARPQMQLNRLEVMVLERRAHQRLARFGSEHSAIAVEFEAGEMLQTDSLSKEIATGKVVYNNPHAAATRIGFFPTRTAASTVLRRLRGRYPSARLVEVAAKEQRYGKLMRLFDAPRAATRDAAASAVVSFRGRAVTPGSIAQTPAPASNESEFSAQLDRSLLDQAREAYLDRDWPRAISLYNKAAKQPDLREEALEMLGVARQRNGQLAQARAVYQTFLAEYADVPSSDRVRQRLQSLTGDDEPRTQMRKPSNKSERAWRTTASLSQFYRRHSLDIDGADKRIPIDAAFTDATLMARRVIGKDLHEGRVSLGHLQDFGDSDSRQALRVQRATWESYFDKLGLSFKLGRQSRYKSGVPGRFDGTTLSYRHSDMLQWNVVGGDLVRTSYSNRDPDQPFVGVSADLKLWAGQLEVSPFFIQQDYDGVLDRRAVGGTVNLRTEKTYAALLLDYDIFHKTLNNLYLNAAYDLSERWRVHTTANHRRSPYLTTSNALIGQAYDDLSELEQDLLDLKLEDVAEDRTATSTMVRIGLDGKIDDTWSFSIEGSAADYGSTNASAGVFALPQRRDYYFSSQVRARGLLGKGSYTTVRVRMSDSDTASTNTMDISSRFRLFDDWQLYGRLMMSQREYDTTGDAHLQIKPSLRVDYRGFKSVRLEAEVGYDWSTRETVANDIDVIGFFFRVGYRANF